MKKTHSIVALVILTVFLTQILARFTIVVDFYVNQEYIAKNLCENKKKPQMHCNGKCHLMKQLKKQEKKESPAPGSQTKEKIETLYCGTCSCLVVSNSIEELSLTQHHFNYDGQLIALYKGAVFQPPQNNG